MKLMQIESEHMEMPEQHYKVTAKVPSVEFQRIFTDLKEVGETMQITASTEPREAEMPEHRIALTVHEPVTAQ